MHVTRRVSRRQRLSRKQLLLGLAFGILIVLTTILAMVLGFWLLKKEEEEQEREIPAVSRIQSCLDVSGNPSRWKQSAAD